LLYLNEKIQDSIIMLTISRSERLNAIGSTLAAELRQSLKSIAHRTSQPNHGIKGVCLSANPVTTKKQNKLWIAGGDLRELHHLEPAQLRSYIDDMHTACHTIESLPCPVLCFVDGQAIGGGAELALAADWRIGSSDASFVFKQLQIGLPTGYGGGQRLVRLLGKAKSQGLLYGGESLAAKDALQLGVLHRAAEKDEDLALFVHAELQRLTSIDLEAFVAQKRILALSCEKNPCEQEKELFLNCWGNPSHAKALQNFALRNDSGTKGKN